MDPRVPASGLGPHLVFLVFLLLVHSSYIVDETIPPLPSPPGVCFLILLRSKQALKPSMWELTPVGSFFLGTEVAGQSQLRHIP